MAFSTALKLNPNATVARFQVSRVYATQGKVTEAIVSTKKLLELHPDYLLAYMLIGSLYEQAGEIDLAQRAYEEALQRRSDYAPALNNLAWLYCENAGNLDMALSLAQRAKSRVPNDPVISDTLAWIEYRKGLFEQAATSLRDVIRQSPQSGLYQYHYGMSLWRMDRSSDARLALQRALQLALTPHEAADAKRVLAALHQRSFSSNSASLSASSKN